MTALGAATHTNQSLSPTPRSFLRALTATCAVWPSLIATPGTAEMIPGFGVHPSRESLDPAKAASDGDESIRPSRSIVPKRRSSICADASPRQSGLSGKL
jgi:hypothetical protein